MSQMSLKICHLYPDALNLYGDQGNIIALRKRCEWRGVDVEVVNACIGQAVDFASCDMLFIGGGQDFDQYALLSDLGVGRPGSKAQALEAAVQDGMPVLAICGGYQLLGEYYKGADGTQVDFVGVLPAYTEAGQERLIGNVAFRADALEGAPVVVGFENHAGRTRLREGVQPLGHVLSGHGNNGEDGTEGARYRNVVATYSHGPLLPKNPVVADALIKMALARKHGEAELAVLDDELEALAHSAICKKLRV